jgi:two-component system sensor histidine kinase/response regulator
LLSIKKINYEIGTNQCYNNIGSIYFDMDKFEIAQSYFRQSLASYTKAKNEIGIGNALYSLGNCYRGLKQDELAIDYYNRSLALREKLGDMNGIGLSRMGLGRAYTQQQKYIKALVNLDTALKYVRILEDKYLEANVLNSIADAYNGEKDYDTAVDYAALSLKVSRAIKSKGTA